MSAPLVFRFHDVATVQIRTDAAFARAFFDAEYGYHRAGSLDAPLPQVCLDLQLASDTPPGFTTHVHKLLARWAYQIKIGTRSVDLQVHGNRVSVPMVHHMLVHPSLRWLASSGGTLLLHAGAVVKNGRSIIFTGRGGAGKTTTTSIVLACGAGWELHSDDYVFLRSGPKSLAYLTRSHLYRGLLDWVPEIGSRLGPWERMRLEFFGALRKYSRERIKWPVRLGAQRLWPGTRIAAEAIPAAIVLLERVDDLAEAALIPLHDLNAVCDELLEMNFGEARHFLALLREAGYLDDAWLSRWKTKEAELLASILAEVPAYRLVLPASKSIDQVGSSLLPLLEKVIGA